MFLRKSVDMNLQQMIEGATAYETYKDIVDMALGRDTVMRTILAEVPLVCTKDIRAYVIEHQSIHNGLLKADPQGNT